MPMLPFLIVGVEMKGVPLELAWPLVLVVVAVFSISAGALTAIFIWGKPRAVTAVLTCVIAFTSCWGRFLIIVAIEFPP